MKKKDLENLIKKEGKCFVFDNKYEIFSQLGIKNDESYSLTENRQVVNKISKESDNFVPDVKNKIYSSLNINNKKDTFWSFIKKPSFYGPTLSLCLCAIICGSIFINRKMNEVTTDTTIAPLQSNTVDLKITSASKKYNPEVLYTVNTNGIVDTNKIISLNDASTNIINQINSANQTTEDFVLNYLNKALDFGYLERLNINEYNEICIDLSFSTVDEEYTKQSSAKLNELIDNFSYENKVVIKYSSNIVSEVANNVDSELLVLIKQAYYITTRVFTKKDGTSSKFFAFSNNINDWIEKYQNFEVDDMEDYVEFLIELEDTISSEEKREIFLNDIDKLTPYLEFTEKLSFHFSNLKSKFNDFIVFAGEKGFPFKNNYEDLDCEPWDWWDSYDFEDDDHFNPHNRRYEDDLEQQNRNFEDFIQYLSDYVFTYSDCKTEKDFRVKWGEMISILEEICDYYEEFVDEIDKGFSIILTNAKTGHYYNKDEHFEDNRHEKPSGWDDDFDDWYEDRHHHHDHH